MSGGLTPFQVAAPPLSFLRLLEIAYCSAGDRKEGITGEKMVKASTEKPQVVKLNPKDGV